MKIKNKNGISIVVATIIIISICVAIAIAVVLWSSGITSIFMKNDKIEFTFIYSSRSFHDYFFIIIEFKNIGETIVRVCNVEINGKPFKEFAHGIILDVANARRFKDLDPSNEETFIDVRPGELGSVGIGIPPYAAYPGQMLHITIYTVNGGEFHVSLILEE